MADLRNVANDNTSDVIRSDRDRVDVRICITLGDELNVVPGLPDVDDPVECVRRQSELLLECPWDFDLRDVAAMVA